MMSVSVIIPWRHSSPQRALALNYVRSWWETTYPTWNIIIGHWPKDRGPWRKGCAIREAGLSPTKDDVVVVADADVIPTKNGIDAVASEVDGKARWGVPFRTVVRLTAEGTDLVLGGRLDAGASLTRTSGVVEEAYVGSPGGGICVVRGDTFNDVPMDPRFCGYGQEDLSWSLALHRLAGVPARSMDQMLHLWHPPQQRMRRGQTTSRGVGSAESLLLWQRYREAATPSAMRILVAEARAAYTLEGQRT